MRRPAVATCSGLVAASALVLTLTACTHSTKDVETTGLVPPMSGVRGDLTYVGGLSRSTSHHREPGVVSAYTQDGQRVALSYFHEGQGYLLRLSPGIYRLVAKSGDAACPDSTVTVVTHRFETIDIRCSVK
jgi:hypothetical protein